MMNQQDIDELTEVFVEESQEIVENLDKDVLELEKYVESPDLDRELLNNIFRYVHTLKGNSGLAGADKLRDLAHKLESLLDRLRKEKMTLTGVMVDILFEGIDRIRSILQEVISGIDQGVQIDDLVGQLEDILEGKTVERSGTSAPTAKVPPPQAPPVKASPDASQQPSLSETPGAVPQLTGIPESIQRVLTEYEEERLREHIAQKHRIYEAALDLMMDKMELAVEGVKDHLSAQGEVIAKVPSSKSADGYNLQVRIIFASALAEQHLRETLSSLPELKGQRVSLTLLIEPEGAAQTEAPETKASPKPVSKSQPAPGEKAVSKPAPPTPPEAKPAPSTPPETPPAPPTLPEAKSVPPKVPEIKPEPARKLPSRQEKTDAAGKPSSGRDSSEQSGNVVRVDIKKLDNLMNIVGELVLAKARYLQFEAELEGESAYKTLRDNLKKNNKSTSKKLEDLREAILQVRMVQVGTLFNRFPRIVRDVAKKNNKRIRLVMEGEETELDKAVVDEMGEPMIHLIRNAADHGIESPDVRRKNGKPEEGAITLRAYQEGSYIVIEIQDDGKGMDIQRIREKAVETGLLEKGAKLTDTELFNFIFHPGFSTAKVVTDTSGRGVGMDSVKNTITRLKGIIEIQTAKNEGTKFIVKLPLTLAIIQVLLIKISSHTYAIPLSSVTESFKLHPEKLELIDGQEVIQLRDLVLPLLRLRDAFGIDGENGHPAPDIAASHLQKHGFVVVIGLAEKKIGVVVDELLEQQEIVIKPLGRYLAHIPGFAGATTLGDGRVVLILDVVGLIENLNAQKLGMKRQVEKPVVPV